MKITHSIYTAILSIILAALSNTLMATLIKIAEEMKQVPSLIVFWRSFWALSILIPVIAFSPPKVPLLEKLKIRQFGLILVRSFTGFCGIYLFFYCVNHLSLAIAIVLFFTSALFMPIVAYIWKKVRISYWCWIGLAIGFIGILFVVKPGHELFEAAALLGLLSGLFTSVGQFSVHLISKTESSNKINFYYLSIIGLLGLMISLIFSWSQWQNLNAVILLIFVGIGLFGFFYLFFLNYGLKHASPPLVSGFLYSSVIFAFILDWLIWHTFVDTLTFIGIIMIISGALLKYFHIHSQQQSHLKSGDSKVS